MTFGKAFCHATMAHTYASLSIPTFTNSGRAKLQKHTTWTSVTTGSLRILSLKISPQRCSTATITDCIGASSTWAVQIHSYYSIPTPLNCSLWIRKKDCVKDTRKLITTCPASTADESSPRKGFRKHRIPMQRPFHWGNITGLGKEKRHATCPKGNLP